ncbi:carboxypeptidase regulatory-like domain-containing protein [Candidatus Woesearchaeota archaeon]|nr:carboxypeptidase regulatory-like domain-containing protein [Candidatus Woesearchaeota archaeon]
MVISNSTQRLIVLFSLCTLLSISTSAFELNGTVLDVDGNALNSSLINVTILNPDFSILGANSTTTNASGWFTLPVADVPNAFYEVRISWKNTTTGATEWVGQNMPSFPSMMLQQIAGTTFYLRQAGTINITAINSTGDAIAFRYQVKDKALGYPIAEEFTDSAASVSVVVPRDRQYSIMVYPDQSMPISFDWTNFSAGSSYAVNSISSFNATTKTLYYKFNTTMNLVQVSGYLNYPGAGVGQWSEFTIIPYLLEPGNMVHAEFGDLPYNISAMFGFGDVFNAADGFYNITLPSTPSERSSMLLFVSARNGSRYYGGFRNISNVGNGLTGFNFTSMSTLVGSPANLTMDTIMGGSVSIPTAKQSFSIVNSTNSVMNGIDVHVEVTLDYSAFQAMEFTWMLDVQQGSNSVFSLPLLNSAGVKEINVFASGGQGDLAPKLESYTLAEIQNPQNITLSSFEPGDIDGADLSGLRIALLKSSAACDVPNPASDCYVGSSGEGQAFGEQGGFNPMKAILSGGKLSFRMGLLSSGIIVHYVNVDMLASGPPDALFDDSVPADGNTSDGFDAAMRFGSNGPTIYDYVLVSMPYAETPGSGLNDSSQVNISIPTFYDEDWNVIWNTSKNGTSVAALASNYSHYAGRQSEWAYLLNDTECTANQAVLNITNPCSIDTANNRIWLRLPHFSGTAPSVSGNTVAAASSSSSSSSSGGSSGGGGGGGGGAARRNTIAAAHSAVSPTPSPAPYNPSTYEASTGSTEESRPLDGSDSGSSADGSSDGQNVQEEAAHSGVEQSLDEITGMAAAVGEGGEVKLKNNWAIGTVLIGLLAMVGLIIHSRRRLSFDVKGRK